MKRGIGSPGGPGFDDGAEPPSKRSHHNSHGHGGYHGRSESLGTNIPRTKHAFKVLITDSLAAGLLGTHGSVKDDIQKETGARLVFSNRNDYFPDTKYRVLGIYADDPNVILDVFSCILPQLVSHGDEERKSQPSGQTDLCGKESGEYIFRFALTRRMQSQIVGSHGSNIKFIRHDSGAKVFVENESVLGHRAGKVIGTPNTILAALRHINDFVQCESEYEEEFYQGFSRIINFYEAQQRGWEPPPEPKDGDKPGGNKRLAGPSGVTTSGVVQGNTKGGKSSQRERGTAPKGGHKKGGGGYNSNSDALKDIVPPPPAVTQSSAAGRHTPKVSTNVGEEVDSLADALESFPSGTVQLQYSLCCEVPASHVGMLVGPGGELIKQAEQASGAKIEIERSKGDQRTMTLVGSLLNVYVAHAMMMSRLKSLNHDEDTAADPKEEEEVREEEDATEEVQEEEEEHHEEDWQDEEEHFEHHDDHDEERDESDEELRTQHNSEQFSTVQLENSCFIAPPRFW